MPSSSIHKYQHTRSPDIENRKLTCIGYTYCLDESFKRKANVLSSLVSEIILHDSNDRSLNIDHSIFLKAGVLFKLLQM